MNELAKKRIEKEYQEYYKHGKIDLSGDIISHKESKKRKFKVIKQKG